MLLGISIGLFVVFLALSVVFYRYCKYLLKKLQQVTDNVDDLKQLLDVYSVHLQQTYQAPTFYGDATLEQLLKHTKEIIKDIEDFNNAFLVEPSKDSSEVGNK
jgi:uncharacterized membrane-anchored protein YhcB (DUF1043 family)